MRRHDGGACRYSRRSWHRGSAAGPNGARSRTASLSPGRRLAALRAGRDAAGSAAGREARAGSREPRALRCAANTGHAERLLSGATRAGRRGGAAVAGSRHRAKRLFARPAGAAGARCALRVDARVVAPERRRSRNRRLRDVLGGSLAPRHRRHSRSFVLVPAVLSFEHARGRRRRPGGARPTAAQGGKCCSGFTAGSRGS
jgi:hypothetical protein